MLKQIQNALLAKADKEKARQLSRFFKTGKGEYGEGDIFLGITVPEQRLVAKKYISSCTRSDLIQLLRSKFHEFRLTGLLILVEQFKTATPVKKKEIVKFYLANTKSVNNWDLVDLSAYHILGEYLLENKKEKIILHKLAKSRNLWERRIAVISTFAFIRESQFKECLKIAAILLRDKHQLIHKAVGWMLREIGKRNKQLEKEFLDKHHKTMPRIMLSYGLEKFTLLEKSCYYKK